MREHERGEPRSLDWIVSALELRSPTLSSVVHTQGNLLGVSVRERGHILLVRSLLKNNKMHDSYIEADKGRIDGVTAQRYGKAILDLPYPSSCSLSLLPSLSQYCVCPRVGVELPALWLHD